MIGQQVYYVTKYGKIRPAMVVEVNSDQTLNLVVFTDGINDPPGSFRAGAAGPGVPIARVERAPYSPDLDPFTWSRGDEAKQPTATPEEVQQPEPSQAG